MYYTTSFKKKTKINSQTSISEIENLIESHTQKPAVKKFETMTYVSDAPWNKISPKVADGMRTVLRILQDAVRKYPQTTKVNDFYFFDIPKASGGTRKISAPNDDLKHVYTNVRDNIREKMMVLQHNNAYAYVKQRSTVDAVRVHQENNSQFFLKIDISNFFDNCTEELIRTQLNQVYPFYHQPEIIELLANFAVLNNGLPQGTPLSPDLTNWIMIPFDAHFSAWCEKYGYIYTRYADDMLISHKEPFKFVTVTKEIEDLFVLLRYPFEIKKKKTRYGSIKGANWNLGLMLNKDNNITVGHQYKKHIKTLLYKVSKGEILQNDPTVLGLLSYLRQVEPGYYAQLDAYCIRVHRSNIKELMTGQGW